MAPEIDLSKQCPAQYVFDNQVQLRLSEIRANEAREKAAKESGQGCCAHFGECSVVASTRLANRC